jgi:hypothetical protein
MNLRALLLIALFFLSGCHNDYGHSVSGDNLTVYFQNKKDQDYAEKIALFWKNENLITNTKQDLQLVQNKSVYELRIIANDLSDMGEISFEEQKLLIGLQRKIEKNVLKTPFNLVICNSRFEPVYSLNE